MNGGMLTPSWHQGLVLEKLSDVSYTGATTSDFIHKEISFPVWIKIKCFSFSQSSMLKDYHQFSTSSNFTYRQLLDRFLDKAISLGFLLENNKVSLLKQKVNVFLYSSLKETSNRLCATVDDSCEPIVGSESKYIQFVFKSLDLISVSETDAFSMMMSSQRQFVLPTKISGTNFPSSLFNFLIEGYIQADLGVSKSDLQVLESLTRVTRDALQNIDKDWRSKFPLRFQHKLE